MKNKWKLLSLVALVVTASAYAGGTATSPKCCIAQTAAATAAGNCAAVSALPIPPTLPDTWAARKIKCEGIPAGLLGCLWDTTNPLCKAACPAAMILTIPGTPTTPSHKVCCASEIPFSPNSCVPMPPSIVFSSATNPPQKMCCVNPVAYP